MVWRKECGFWSETDVISNLGSLVNLGKLANLFVPKSAICATEINLTLTSVLGMRDDIYKWLTIVPGTHVLHKEEILVHKIGTW